MLLNHFCWDKEKLMERYYDGDQQKLFSEAHVANPFVKPSVAPKLVKKDSRRGGPSVEDCEVCSKHNLHIVKKYQAMLYCILYMFRKKAQSRFILIIPIIMFRFACRLHLQL